MKATTKKKATKSADLATSDNYTAARFAVLTGIDRHELQHRLEEMKAIPSGKSRHGGNTYSLRSLVSAFAGGDHEAEKRAKTRAERERIELQNARSRGELIEVVKVEKLMQACFAVHRTRILNFPMTDEEKQACLSDLMALQKIDWEREAGL